MQLGAGGITPHFTAQKKDYCNQWNNTGIIVNKSYYIRFMAGDVGITFVTGDDSICSKVDGIFLHYILSRSEIVEWGITLGGYEFDMNKWEQHAEDTPTDISAPDPVWTRWGDKTIVPVLALDLGIHLIRHERWSLKLNNIFTPVIWNHSLAWEYRF